METSQLSSAWKKAAASCSSFASLTTPISLLRLSLSEGILTTSSTTVLANGGTSRALALFSSSLKASLMRAPTSRLPLSDRSRALRYIFHFQPSAV